MNINRDYLIINDVKKSNIKLDNGSMFFYITDKNTQNIFVNLVINVSNNDLIQKYANIENAEDYTLTMNIVKPDNTYKIVEGKLHDKEKAIFEFNLNEECCDEIGSYRCELLTKCNINGHEEVTTSNKLTYKVKSSVLNDLDDIVEAPEYPLVIQLFDKLSDIEQYEEDRRANELARQLAEEQRQTRFDALDADMTDRVTAMDDKMVDVENRVSIKEQAVDTLIADTKAEIDEYKVAKDQEIDEYKALKDTEINNAITAQDNKIDEAISNQNDRIVIVENNVVAQNDKLDVLENKGTLHESRLDAIEAKNTEQDNRLDIAENRLANIGDDITNTMQPIIDAHTSRLDAIEAIDVSQNTRLDAIEAKNQQQDDRLLDIEKVNNRQNIDIKCLYGASQTIDVTEEGNSIHLQNSNNGFAIIDEIKGNTLVNCNKESNKELILNGNINTSGDNAVTLTEGVDGGLVDVALEGNTLVNVSKTKDSTAITKAYTVENSGNHVALQGEYDGSCRPAVTGNTLVNRIKAFWNNTDAEADYSTGSYKCVANGVGKQLYYSINAAVNTKYTFIANIKENTINSTFALGGWGITNDGSQIAIPSGFTGLFVKCITTKGSELSDTWNTDLWQENTEGKIEFDGFMILEGDYTDKPIPDYFTGLQSSFEDNLVTQEMVDNGEEVADNLGKYRVDYKVTGKNLFDGELELGNIHNSTGGLSNSDLLLRSVNFIPVISGSTITLSNNMDYHNYIYEYDGNYNYIKYTGNANDIGFKTITLNNNTKFIKFRSISGNTENNLNVKYQLEEGNTATEYEPYKESTKTLYLNSPLLEGDTIEEKDGGIYHVHRSTAIVSDGSNNENWAINGGGTTGKYFIRTNIPSAIKSNCRHICDKLPSVAYGDLDSSSKYGYAQAYGIRINISEVDANNGATVADFRQWLQSSPITTVYELKTPQYELIEQSNLAIPSYTNGHLDLASAVPVSKVNFLHFEEELTYLYPATSYTLQFISDKAITVDITLGGTQLLAQSIVKGLNRISITTPATLVDNKLVINGVGAKISEIVVTDTDREFGYFEGMKSVGECEDNVIDILLTNKNLFDINIFNDINNFKQCYGGNAWCYYPIFIGIGNKAYLKRKYKDNVTNYPMCLLCNDANEGMNKTWLPISHPSYTGMNYSGDIIADSNGYVYILITVSNINNYKNILDEVIISITNSDYVPHAENKKQILLNEPLRAVGDAKDRYVLIDGKWYIERNCKEVILDGVNNLCIGRNFLDTDTTVKLFFSGQDIHARKAGYVISPNLPKGGGDTEHIAVDGTSPYGNIRVALNKTKLDYSSLNSINSYLQSNNIRCVLELASPTYEPIDYNPLEVYSGTTHITTNSTIPCNITVKNHGFNCLLKPSTTYTVSSNLGLNTVTTPSVLTEDCLRFMDTDTSDVTTMRDVLVLEGDWTTKADLIPANFNGIESAFEQEYDAEKGKYKVNVKVANEDRTQENNITFYINEPLRGVGDTKDKVFIKDDKVVVQRNCGVRAYEDGDFGTYPTDKVDTVYPLAEPTYEEVEYNDTKLFIESFKNSTLSYNSNVPVTSKLYYSYSVPIVDTVAQTASISDEQDVMIIDLASQVAVMEMLLM